MQTKQSESWGEKHLMRGRERRMKSERDLKRKIKKKESKMSKEKMEKR